MLDRARGWLERPRFPWVAALVGCVLALPGLRGTLAVDDYVHRAVLMGTWPTDNALLELFSFATKDAAKGVTVFGFHPWWTHPELSVALFRPVAAATHVVDYTLWPNAIVVQQLHSLLWYSVGILIVSAIYRSVAPGAVGAGLATLMFAVEDAHGTTAVWLANRNALVALVFAGLAVLFHIRWRSSGQLRYAVLAAGAFATGLLGAEASIAAFAYVVAYESTLGAGPWHRRLTALSPYAAITLVWRFAYDAMGYGVSGSGLYVDPGRSPVDFLQAVALRLPVLLFSQWTQAPVDFWMAMPRWSQLTLCFCGIATGAAVLALFFPLLRRSATARFWALGMVLSAIPVCAAFPMDRLLLFVGIGAFGLLAELASETRPSGGWRRGATRALLVIHVPLAALCFPLRSTTMSGFGDITAVALSRLPSGPAVAAQTFVFINGMDVMTFYFSLIPELEGRPRPKYTCQLASMFDGNTVERVDETTLALRPDRGFLAFDGDRLLRDTSAPFRVGEGIRRPEVEARVLETTPDGLPSLVHFDFGVALEDESLRWFVWRNGELVPFDVPAVGQRVEVPATMFDIWLGRERPVRILDLE